MTISLLIDFIILLALLAVFIFGLILWRRIERLQNSLADLGPALQAFCDAVDLSQQSVGEMRLEADRLQKQALRIESGVETSNKSKAAPKAQGERSDLVRMFFETARKRSNS